MEADPQRTPHVKGVTRGLGQWLWGESLSLFVSTYQHDTLIILSGTPSDDLCLTAYPFDRPMGMAVSPTEFKLATRQHLWNFRNSTQIVTDSAFDESAIYQLQSVIPTGYLDAHDVASPSADEAVIVDTHHSCLRRVTAEGVGEPVWKPEFISDLAPEDRCHLNGLASEGGKPRYATVVACSDQAEGWRQDRRRGGALLDIETDDVIAQNLSMPHSPRVYRDRIWLLNAGTGEFGFVEAGNGGFHPIAFCPGFLRGLAFYQDYAIVGLSQARRNRKFTDLDLDDQLVRHGKEAICGLMFIHLTRHEIHYTVEFESPLTELFDVQALADTRHPTLLKCRTLE